MKLSWRPAAETDRSKIFEYIYIENRQAAIDLDEAFDHHVERLIKFPPSGRLGRVRGTRELILTGTPYIVVYRVLTTELVILRLFHGAQLWPDQIP